MYSELARGPSFKARPSKEQAIVLEASMTCGRWTSSGGRGHRMMCIRHFFCTSFGVLRFCTSIFGGHWGHTQSCYTKAMLAAGGSRPQFAEFRRRGLFVFKSFSFSFSLSLIFCFSAKALRMLLQLLKAAGTGGRCAPECRRPGLWLTRWAGSLGPTTRCESTSLLVQRFPTSF